MTERFHDRPPEPAVPVAPSLPLPEWLARRILEPGETIALVRGPTGKWWLEPYLTHPLASLAGAIPAAVAITVGRMIVPSWRDLPPAAGIVAVLFVFASVFVVGLLAGYFTRLVVTDRRLLILQGREIWSSRGIDELPPFLVRRMRDPDGRERRAIDIVTLDSMLGSSNTGIVDSDTILTLGKKIDKLKERRDDTV